MIKKGLIYLTTTLMILLLVSFAVANIPPPSANQNIGIYDTFFAGFNTSECKECHTEDLVSRHHSLVFNESYKCMDCHQMVEGGNQHWLSPFKECSDCHLNSPHHATDDAQKYNCSECHNFVDDWGDGHVVPDHPQSDITPDTSYNFKNESGVKIGGCEACHEPDSSAVPEIKSNNNTHHHLTNFTLTNCHVCHQSDSSTGTPGEGTVALDIRYCERCHGIKSLHNIQYDYENTNGLLGYGHIGDDWDCLGCHGYPALYGLSSPDDPIAQLNAASLASLGGPLTGPIIPTIHTVSPSEITEGQYTAITIDGINFINEFNGVNYTCNVTLNNKLVIEPDSITTTEIVVTIPGILEPDNYDVRVVKDGNMESNKKSLVVVPKEPLFIIVQRKQIVE